MKQLVMSFAIALFAVVAAHSGVEPNTGPSEPNLYIVHFTRGPEWKAGSPFSQQQHASEHSRNLVRLREEGTLLFGGRYGDTGMVVLRSTSETQARSYIERDPAVQAGVFSYTLDSLSPFFEGCITRNPEPSAATDPGH